MSNMSVPPLPRRYLEGIYYTDGVEDNVQQTHGMLSRRKAEACGSGKPMLGEVKIDATYSTLPIKANTNNDMERP